MEYTNLGRTGLRVSRLCLGTMNFGPKTTEPDSFQIMDHALELGIQFYDTANVYGWKLGEGITEQIVGRWFAQGGGRREKTVIATKLYGGMGDWPNQTFLSALAIRQQCDASLKRLQTDYIDLYQMHHIDRDAPWEELWEAFDILKQQGKILYVGSSNFPGWGITQGNERARQRGSMGLVSEQSYYNLMSRTVELEVIPACQQYGVGLIPWSPLNRGLLGGILRKQKEGRSADENTQKNLELNRAAIEDYEAFCDDLGHDPADVGLA
jgi:aryl-alcohol dehydrogenase-like predicted oxidoreductase